MAHCASPPHDNRELDYDGPETSPIPLLRRGVLLKEELPDVGPRKYPVNPKFVFDPPGEEAADDAHVWKVYLNEAERIDAHLIRGFCETIDSLLIFAALFSAVITTFVVESSGALQPDHAQILTYLMAENNQLLRANNDLSKLANVSASQYAPGATTHSQLDLWTNSLFFLALALSLAVTLASVFIRQGLQAFAPLSHGSSKQRALVRHYFFLGIQKWKIQEIISALPLALHLSLGIFFVGLILFVRARNAAISWIIVAVAAFFFALYIIAICLPAIYTDCPLRIPILDRPAQMIAWFLRLIRHLWRRSSILLSQWFAHILAWRRYICWGTRQARRDYSLPSSRHRHRASQQRASHSTGHRPQMELQRTFQTLPQARIFSASTHLLARLRAVAWLGGVTINPIVKLAAIQSLAALLPGPRPGNSTSYRYGSYDEESADSWNQLSLPQMTHIVQILLPLYPMVWHKVSETTLKGEEIHPNMVFSSPSRENVWIRCEVLLRSLIMNFGDLDDWSEVIRLRTRSFMDAIRTKSLHRLQVVLGSRFVYQLYGIDVGPVQGTSQINPRRHFPHPTDHWSWSENYPPDFDVSCRFFSHSEDLTALHFLAKINDIRTTKLLLSLCYPPDVDVVAGELMETPLHIACATGAIQIVQLLCEHLANPSIQDKWGRTPFNVALMNGKIEVAEYLLNRPAFRQLDPSTRTVTRVLPTRELLGSEEYQSSYLYLAAKWGSYLSTETLLKEGASPHVDFGTSPLSVACLYGWTEIVQLLLEYHVDLAASRTSYPPLIFACEAGNLIMVRLLLDAGADPNVHGVAGMSQMPHGFNCDESMLLQDREGENDERLVRGQLYLRPHGQTPLHIACYLGYTEIVQLLLERGADTDISDSDNNRPLDVARQFEREELVPILELYDLPMR